MAATAWWHRALLWLPAAAWASLIFTLSSRSRIPAVIPDISDKVLHLIAFGVLGALAYLGASDGFSKPGVRAAMVAALSATAYGAFDEIHQYFVPGRHSDAADLAADFVGATAAAFAVTALLAWRRRVFSSPLR